MLRLPIFALISLALSYATFAFVAGSLDPFEWAIGGRFMMIVMTFSLTMMLPPFYYMMKDRP